MLILSRSDVEDLLTMEDAIAAVEEGFRQLAVGAVVMPQRVATPIERYAGLHLSMPAYVAGVNQPDDTDALAIKVVTVYGENHARFNLPMIQGVLLLYDARNGQLLAMMDAEHLTAMRTGAASGVATRYLARENASMVTIFGTGAQAGPQLAAVCAVRPISQAMVVSKSGRHDTEFCLHWQNKLGIPVRAAGDARAAVESADIICTATNSTTPVFNGNWLQEGTHINAVGAYTATMRELDTVTMGDARIFVDRHEAARTEAGDILIPIQQGEFTYDRVVGELGDVIQGTTQGRLGQTDITLFKSVGLAMQDAVTAARVYRRAREKGLGKRVDL